MSPPCLRRATTLLILGLSVPTFAAERAVDGLVIGKTPCAEAVRTLHARHRERIQAATEVPADDSVEMNGLRHLFKKPAGDKTPYKVMRAEASKQDEAWDLEQVAKGFEKRGLNTEECNPFGYMSTYTMPLKALNIPDPVPLDVTKLGLKKCPYGSEFISVAAVIPEVRVLCLDGVVAVYAKEVPVPMPKLTEELAAKEGPPRDLGFDVLGSDINVMEVSLYSAGTAFRHANEAIVIEGYGTAADGPVKLKRKGYDFIPVRSPKALDFQPKSTVFYLSKAAMDTVERDQKIYDELKAKAAARKKKRP